MGRIGNEQKSRHRRPSPVEAHQSSPRNRKAMYLPRPLGRAAEKKEDNEDDKSRFVFRRHVEHTRVSPDYFGVWLDSL